MTTFKFTEEYIQDKLNSFFAINSQKYVIENLYIFSWESDKFIETRSGLIYEFEIKISRSDFKNDFNKKDKHVILEGKEEFIPSYDKVLDQWKDLHEEYYKTANYKRPNYFYYAVPEGLITKEEVPDYAGLVYVTGPEEGGTCEIIKKAPKLHDKKYSDDDLKLGEKFYYNMLSWKDKCKEEKKKRLLTEDEGHKIPYAELLEKYETLKKEYKAVKSLADSEAKTVQVFAGTMQDDRRIIRGYQLKMKEIDPNFNFTEFEDQFLEDYK